MFSNPTVGMSSTDDSIMFNELSFDIQERILSFAGVASASEKFWDVLPVAYIYQDKSSMAQYELDDEALLQLGVI
jgi:hypothetical protein